MGWESVLIYNYGVGFLGNVFWETDLLILASLVKICVHKTVHSFLICLDFGLAF